MQWSPEEAGDEGNPHGPKTRTRARRWPWRLGFGLAAIYAWAFIGLYFMVLAIGGMADCFGTEPCTSQQHQEIVNGATWGEIFAACTLIATVLCVLATEGRRWAASALVLFSIAVALGTYSEPSDEAGMTAIGAMAITLAPLAVLGAWRWWSLRDSWGPID